MDRTAARTSTVGLHIVFERSGDSQRSPDPRDGTSRNLYFLGKSLFGPNYEPWVIFVLPPGGFFTIGFILLGLNWVERRKKQKPMVREWPEGVASEKAA